ncbi:MAG: ribonuclease HII [Puniceicoccales bacterium]|jgi:ribonuclease HII|nr:ribonuclease HII [Puniceicoccales bacterium]
MSKLTRHDRRLLAQNPLGIVGVDEAGRGAFAGPVSAAAVWLDASFFADRRRVRLANQADDSKKLSPAAREEIHDAILAWRDAGALRAAQAFASVVEIDAYNILGATRLAMHRCLRALAGTEPGAEDCPLAAAGTGEDTPLFATGESPRPLVLVDGTPLRAFAWRHRALVGGDGRSLAIALASIFAKVRRDHLMSELGARFPDYGFAEHKGYGTPAHAAAIREHGPCAEHRPLFLRSLLAEAAADAAATGATQCEFVFDV